MGFQFQDRYLLLRVLRVVGVCLDSAWASGTNDVSATLSRLPYKFGLEASAAARGGEAQVDWDVLVFNEANLEFAEVKSGMISKEDRIAFWRRLRHELDVTRDTASVLSPVLVVDPSKADDLTKWQGLPSTAVAFTGTVSTNAPQGNVSTSEGLFAEALWELCRVNASGSRSDPAVAFDVARDALSRFRLDCHDADQLETEVNQYLEVLFPGGLTDTQYSLLLGWLSRRATESRSERRLFTIRELLEQIGILQDAISIGPAALREWRDLWNGVPQRVQTRTRRQLGQSGASIEADQVQPVAVQALAAGRNRGLVILGAGGAGKSTFLAQAAAAAAARGDVVLHCGADDVTTDELEALMKSFRFRAAITALRRPSASACIFVDGLDEAEPSLRKRWAQLLVRLNAIPNAHPCVSIRDETWRTDGEVRAQLEAWLSVSLEQWPETLVRDLLAPTPYHAVFPSAVVELLRTPIMLDLFWRTFVESNTANVERASRLQTRHNLLSAFWEVRLLGSPRHTGFRDKASRFATVFSQVAQSVGPFLESGLNGDAVQVLISEGVLVREGRLQPRLRFRHPLLRDFAFAQSCLSTENPREAAKRWLSIDGGLQRHGSLRAIFEALSDLNAQADYPGLTLVTFVQASARESPSAAKHVAHVLGTRHPTHGLDPAAWPLELQHTLPAEFGRELIASARFDANATWATPLQYWPEDAAWFDDGFPEEVWKYASFLKEALKQPPSEAALHEQTKQAARTLRRLSETQRFHAEFAKHDRWLKMQAIRCIPSILPDNETLAWLEREMPQASWRTRAFLMEQLIYLAPVDEARTARLYRTVVGLHDVNGRFRLDASSWNAVQNHHAVQWSLAGEDNHRSLIKEYPSEFLPVALELAEALWENKHGEKEESHSATIGFMRQFDARWADPDSEKRDKLGELIDDALEWSYWRSFPSEDNYERCLSAIHECAENQMKNLPTAFLSEIAPRLKASRLATVQSILLDILIANPPQEGFTTMIGECLLDGRLYHVSGLRYWIEQGLIAAWHSLIPEERAKVLNNIDSVRDSIHLDGERYHKLLIARLPARDLPEAVLQLRPQDGDLNYKPCSRPRGSSEERGAEFAFGGIDDQDRAERFVGEWPESFDREVLKLFYRIGTDIQGAQTTKEKLQESLPRALGIATLLLPLFRSHYKLLQESHRFWVWDTLTAIFDCHHKTKEIGNALQAPAPDLVHACSELAFAALAEGHSELKGKLPESDVWMGCRESAWTHALKLADATLVWPPIVDDHVIQRRFGTILEAAFVSGQPLVQLVCTTTVRSWHWFRNEERRQLHDRLVWNMPKHASVLSWSLARTLNYADGERANVFRLLLNRDDVEDTKNLADRLGQYVGVWSMHVFADGNRSAVADLAREAVSSPNTFRLLKDPTCCREFLGSMVFGMKEQATKMHRHAELANDYGAWNLKAWQSLRGHKKRRKGSSGVVLHATHWLEKKEGNESERAALKPWWRSIQPLLRCVVHQGGRGDCFTLFFNLRDGVCNDLASPEELMRLVEPFGERMITGVATHSLDLDARNPEQDEHESWRDCASYAAETIDSLRKDGSLRTDLQRDQAHRLLSLLASEPIRSPKAVEALHRLQNE
jgi:hypothetical protein